jgi:hypothetical protein
MGGETIDGFDFLKIKKLKIKNGQKNIGKKFCQKKYW